MSSLVLKKPPWSHPVEVRGPDLRLYIQIYENCVRGYLYGCICTYKHILSPPSPLWRVGARLDRPDLNHGAYTYEFVYMYTCNMNRRTYIWTCRDHNP
jgi:hypothetical protein